MHRPSKRPSRSILIATIASVLVATLFVAGYFLAGPLLKDRIVKEAEARGVDLAFNEAHFWWWSASIDGVRFRLTGVPGIEGQARSIDVSLAGWDPTRILASGVTVDVQGSAVDLALAVGEWTKNHPSAYALPVSASDLAVSWSPAPGTAPWLVVKGGTLKATPSGVTFSAEQATVSNVDVGTVGATWTTEGAVVKLGFGTTNPAVAPLSASVSTNTVPPTARITLAPTDLTKLAAPLDVALKVTGVTASGTADLVLPPGLQSGKITGHIDMRLDGFVPPHPVELDGFLFGSTTLFATDLEISPDRASVDLKRSHVQAGAFELGGSGHVARSSVGQVATTLAGAAAVSGPYAATIMMNLAGNLPCAAVAQSAAAAHADTVLAHLAGDAARRILDGSLSVHLQITADTRNLEAARVEPTIGVGCGIGPLKDASSRLVNTLTGRARDLARSLGIPDLMAP